MNWIFVGDKRVAVLCIPDNFTADKLICDKICTADWELHLGRSKMWGQDISHSDAVIIFGVKPIIADILGIINQEAREEAYILSHWFPLPIQTASSPQRFYIDFFVIMRKRESIAILLITFLILLVTLDKHNIYNDLVYKFTLLLHNLLCSFWNVKRVYRDNCIKYLLY